MRARTRSPKQQARLREAGITAEDMREKTYQVSRRKREPEPSIRPLREKSYRIAAI